MSNIWVYNQNVLKFLLLYMGEELISLMPILVTPFLHLGYICITTGRNCVGQKKIQMWINNDNAFKGVHPIFIRDNLSMHNLDF
jgi:hypothetical protein